MKNWFWICLILLLAGCISPRLALAHFSATDRDITAVLHVEPNDSPIPGQPVRVYFDIIDKTQNFTLSDCDCAVSISEHGKQIKEQSLPKTTEGNSGLWSTSIPFVFPDRTRYDISISGNPISPNAFQPFHLSWNFLVDQYPTTIPSSSEIFHDTAQIFIYIFSIAVGIMLCFFAVAFFIRRKKK